METSSHSSESVEAILQEENIVDYERDTGASEGEDPEHVTSASRKPSCIVPCLFPAQSTARELTTLRASISLDEPIITNKLDDEKQQQIEGMRGLDVYPRY